MRALSLLIFSLLFIVTGQVSATIIKYEYSFDTPSFDAPPFGALNTFINGAGSLVTGTVTVDTDNIASSSGGYDIYYTSSGGFTHVGEWDDLFTQGLHTLMLLEGTTTLYRAIDWTEEIDGLKFELYPLFSEGAVEATCRDNSVAADGCAGEASYRQIVVPTNFTLRTVPEPTTIALMAFGFAVLGFTRRRTKA